MSQPNEMTLIFRCARELAAILPPPIPAVQGLPDWFKAVPQKTFNVLLQEESQTLKRCPPFIDAMTYGFLIPLACDLRIENGEFNFGTWKFRQDRSPPFARRSAFTTRVRSKVRPSSPRIASSLSSRISGRSKRRRAIRCCSRTRRTAPICRSRPSPVSSIRICTKTISCIFGRSGIRRFQRRAAKGNAGRAVHSDQARKLERANRDADRRGSAPSARIFENDRSRKGNLSPAVQSQQNAKKSKLFAQGAACGAGTQPEAAASRKRKRGQALAEHLVATARSRKRFERVLHLSKFEQTNAQSNARGGLAGHDGQHVAVCTRSLRELALHLDLARSPHSASARCGACVSACRQAAIAPA